MSARCLTVLQPGDEAALGEARRVLRLALSKPLPGGAAWAAMTPPYRCAEELSPGIVMEEGGREWREAAVLILLHPTPSGLAFPLIERPGNMRHHAGQIAFPGGGLEPAETALDAALREAREEIGINLPRADIVGALSDIAALPSGYLVHPFVALARDIGELALQPGEVAGSFEPTLAELFDERAVSTFTRRREGGGRQDWNRQDSPCPVPCYRLGGKIVWGLTAMILAELKAAVRPALELGKIRN
ncbi:CoA pyrophosphatase [bacterium]|nr:CoA pyrophosphatase [bacterium]